MPIELSILWTVPADLSRLQVSIVWTLGNIEHLAQRRVLIRGTLILKRDFYLKAEHEGSGIIIPRMFHEKEKLLDDLSISPIVIAQREIAHQIFSGKSPRSRP